MIQYTLKCAQGHSFDSWFQSAAAFDKLLDARLVSCLVCGGVEVTKAIMAPRVRPARDAVPTPAAPPPTEQTASRPKAGADRPLSTPSSPAERKLAELRRKIEANADYVGRDFAAEARAMHDGDAPARSIYGEAKPEEAKSLLEDGVPVAPLPFLPNRKTN